MLLNSFDSAIDVEKKDDGTTNGVSHARVDSLESSDFPVTTSGTDSSPTAEKTGREPTLFVVALVAVFFLFGLFGVGHHEMWRDEIRAWMIARESSSIFQLFDILRYEGTPPLWHLCLYAITRFTDNPQVMQVFHLLIATCSIGLMALFAPFTQRQKVLFAFGYFPFFEYGIISRSYALGALFLFAVCAMCKAPTRKYLPIFLMLALLASTTIYGAIIAFSIGIGLLLELFEVNGKRFLIRNKRLLTVGLIVFSLSACAFVSHMKPPDSAYRGDWKDYAVKFFRGSDSTLWRLEKSSASLLSAYLPIPDPRSPQNFWGSTIFFDQQPYRAVWFFLSVFTFLSVVALFKDTLSRTSYALGTLGISGFTFLFFIGSIRHYGQLFFCWLPAYG